MSTALRTLWTIGHSTRTWHEFVSALTSFEIQVLADVRRFPGSRKYPHFNAGVLQQALPLAGIEYLPLPELGGRRAPQKDSPNTAWRNDAFRGYADYMETDEFRDAIARLLETAAMKRTAIMCAEAVWWRCHRGLIADYLKARGFEVIHIMATGKCEPHPYTSAARVVDGQLSYAAEG